MLVPVPPEDFGALGLLSLRRAIRRVQAGPNPRLRMLGFLLSMVNKSLSIHSSYEADLRSVYGEEVFATVVPLAKDYKEAVLARRPVGVFKPRRRRGPGDGDARRRDPRAARAGCLRRGGRLT